MAKQFLTFVSGAPFQPAIAVGLRLPDAYFDELRATLRGKRDRLCAGLREVGFEVFVPQGTYFVTADVRPLGCDDGVEFCRDLPHAVPASWRSRTRCSTTTSRPAGRWCGSRSASATRSSTRRSPACAASHLAPPPADGGRN